MWATPWFHTGPGTGIQWGMSTCAARGSRRDPEESRFPSLGGIGIQGLHALEASLEDWAPSPVGLRAAGRKSGPRIWF